MIIKLGEALDKRNMSATDFAKETGTSSAQMTRYFREGNPKIGTIMKWAKTLGVKIKDLIYDDGEDAIIITRPRTAIESIERSERGGGTVRKYDKL